MKNKVILEVNGVKHKLIKTRSLRPCGSCSLKNVCLDNSRGEVLCIVDIRRTHFIKCKPGE